MIVIKYRLVAVDVDGTLLNSKGVISDKTLDAIKRLNDKGIKFVVCSGRPGIGVKKLGFIKDTDSPSVLCNGALIADLNRNKVLYYCGIEDGDAEKIIEKGFSFDTTMFVWSGDSCFCSKLNELAGEYKKISGVEPVLFSKFSELSGLDITKILWFDRPDAIKEYMKILENEQLESVSWCTSNPAFLELMNSNVSKAAALEKIGEIFGINREEMIAIGDGENDLSMIEYAGLGVAMENASESVRKKADLVTLSNDEDGVAFVINKYCFDNTNDEVLI